MVRWWHRQSQVESTAPRPRWSRAVRLLVRGVLAGIMWLILVAAILTAGLFESSALREKILVTGLDVAARYVPGTVQVGRMQSPELGHLRLVDLVWSSGQAASDTLAHVALLDLRLDVAALRFRDVRVDSLQLVVTQLDGPGINTLLQDFAATDPDTGQAEAAVDTSGAAAFPRPGAIPGVPSVALAHWRLALTAAVLTKDMKISNLVCTGALEAGTGRQAQAVVEHLELDFATTAFDSISGHPWGLSLEHLGLGLTLEAESDSLTSPELVVAVMDSFSLRFDAVGNIESETGSTTNTWWQAAGPVRLENTARVTHTDGVYRGSFSSDFVLPGATELASLLPDSFPTAHFDQIVGRLSLAGEFSRPRLGVRLDLDLDQTGWLDTGLLAARLDTDLDELINTGLGAVTVELDTLDFSLLGVGVRAGGTLRQGELAATMRAAVTDSQLAAVFPVEVLQDLDVALALAVQVGGTLQQPTLAVDLQGGLDSPWGRVPRLSLRGNAGPAGGDLDLNMAGGILAQGVSLDSLSTQVKIVREADDALNGDFAFAVWRGADRLALGGRAWADSLGLSLHKRVQLDSLVVVSIGQEMRLSEPATLELGPGPWDIALTPLVFAGEPGEISFGGRSDDADLDLTSQVTLFLPEDLLNQLYPSDIWTADGGRDFTLAANAELQGTRAAPTLAGELRARLSPHREDPELGLDLDFKLAAGDTAGLTAEMAFVSADSVVLGGSLRVPGQMNPETGQWRHTPGRPAHLTIPDQTLGLQTLNRLLPPEVSVEGALTVGLDIRVPWTAAETDSNNASGAPGEIEARIKSPLLAIRMPNRSRIDLAVDVQVHGSLLEPTVGGRIVVESGFFRIPELPRNLHTVEVEPLLWALVAADSSTEVQAALPVFVKPENLGPVVEPGGVGVLPEMDLEIEIPGNLRIHGYGLDIELAGDLKVGRGFDEDDLPQPKVQGEVHTVQGTLQFMNRVFKVERGVVRFNGAVPPNPVLDMMLEADVTGTLVRILVTGTASDPVIELSSEPDYEQQDIMAVLLFGRPLGELDNDQRGGVRDEGDPGQELRQNMAGLAMVFGTAGLQNSVSNAFGVDMVEVGSDSEGDSTLMVGKFINPKLMLKYHVSLEKSGTYFLTMEYTLSRLFKLVTTYGQGEEDSGLELKWSRRY